MKHFLLSVLAIVAGTAAAFCGVDALRIHTGDGNTFCFAFDKSPEISFDGNGLTVTTADADAATFTFEQVTDFDFGEYEASGIGAPAVSAIWDGTTLSLSGLADGSAVRVYDLGGRLLLDKKASGTFKLDRSALPRGIYILRAGDFTVKFTL